MYKRFLIFGLVLGCGQVAEARDDASFLTFEGTTTETLTVWLEWTSAGDSPHPSDLINYKFPQVVGGASALDVRNTWVPEEGAAFESGILKRIRFNGKPAIFFGPTVTGDAQFWLSDDGGSSWHLLEPSVPVTLSGIAFTHDSHLTRDPAMQPQGTIPAVGGLGLLLMFAAMIAAGAWIMRRRRTLAAGE